MQEQKPAVFNLPNALTMMRMLLIPVFWLLMANNQLNWALAVFVLASITDVLDGWIARHYNLITNFGKLFDPLADKLMVLSVMISLVLRGIVPLAALLILLCKELLMLLGGFLLLRRKIVVYSERLGKIAQFVTLLGLCLCFFHQKFAELGRPIHLWVLWTGIGLAMLSLFYYARRNGVKLLKNHQPNPPMDQESKQEEA